MITRQYSPIAPIALLHELADEEMLGGYLLLLAHDVNAHPLEYQELVEKMREQCREDIFIIMDNGVVELDKPIVAEELIGAAITVGANVVCLPDAIGNFRETKALIEFTLSYMISSGIPLMCIPQGSNTHEITQCALWMQNVIPVYDTPWHSNDVDDTSPRVHYWGVPRHITNNFEGHSRIPTIQLINNLEGEHLIHLLGMSNNLKDDIRCTSLPSVMGIDSANPLVLGRKDIIMGIDDYQHVDRQDFWYDKKLYPHAIGNIEHVRNLIEAA